MLAQILTPQARERLNRIALVKAEKAAQLENSLIQAVMIKMLEQQTPSSNDSGIKIVRRRGYDDDDDDDLSAFK